MALALAPKPVREPGYAARLAWAAVLSYASGFPFGVYLDVWPVYFRTHGISLTAIGALTLLSLPWTWKPLWAPLVDRFGLRRSWAAACTVAMALVLFAQPLFDPSHLSPSLWALLFIFIFASATLDIAVDGQTIVFLRRGEEGAANGLRAAGYRIAVITSGAGMVAAADFFGWSRVFVAAGMLQIVIGLVLLRSPEARSPASERRFFFAALVDWVRRPGAAVLLAFILLYRLGDLAIGPMVKPYWVDRGMSLTQIATVSTTFGMVAGVVGALTGGFFTTRFGLLPALWILGATQGLSNAGYLSVAAFNASDPWLYAASLFESFTLGLAGTAFLSLLMRLCDKDQASTEYALLASIYALPRFIVGPFSGAAVERLGYAAYFAFTVALSVPAFFFLPAVARNLKRRTESPAQGGTGERS